MKKCPVCGIFMNEVLKLNVQIDICPKCEGIWLDKGELEKISSQYKQLDSERPRQYNNDNDHYDKRHDDRDDDHHYDKGHNNRQRRGGFWENLFD
ncbi:MAG: zf-TFIIB domain-containing protein [Ignavibacteria bacterium]